MLLAVTGTPGTGKSSVCNALGLEYVDLNRVIRERGFYSGVDPERGSLIADLDRLRDYLRQQERPLLIVEGHLAHLLEPEAAVVLRASPVVLAERLEQKGFPPQKIQENVEAEALDIILAEAVELCAVVYEVDTSALSVKEVAAVVRAIIDAEKAEGEAEQREALKQRYKPGSVNWLPFFNAVFGLMGSSNHCST
jgi:adenylate kinase